MESGTSSKYEKTGILTQRRKEAKSQPEEGPAGKFGGRKPEKQEN
jgi:hypothetical protein